MGFLKRMKAKKNLFPNFSKDVRLPQQLQRAMAAEAEAAREARAKVSTGVKEYKFKEVTWYKCFKVTEVKRAQGLKHLRRLLNCFTNKQ